MTIKNVSNNNIIDRVPILSTVNSLGNLLQKLFSKAVSAISKLLGIELTLKGRTSVLERSNARDIALLIPFIGNISVFIYDKTRSTEKSIPVDEVRKWTSKAKIEELKKDPSLFEEAGELKSNHHVIQTILPEVPEIFYMLPADFQNKPHLKAVHKKAVQDAVTKTPSRISKVIGTVDILKEIWADLSDKQRSQLIYELTNAQVNFLGLRIG